MHEPCHVENKIYLVCFDKHIVNLLCLKCCLKYISGVNISPPNRNLFTISFILYLVLTCYYLERGPTKGILRNPNLGGSFRILF